EADVAEIVTEAVGAIRRLQTRIAEPQPQLLQPDRPSRPFFSCRRGLDLGHHVPRRTLPGPTMMTFPGRLCQPEPRTVGGGSQPQRCGSESRNTVPVSQG